MKLHAVRIFSFFLCVEAFVLVIASAITLGNATEFRPALVGSLSFLILLAVLQFVFAIRVWKSKVHSKISLLAVMAIEVLLGGYFALHSISFFFILYCVGFVIAVWLLGKQLFMQEQTKKR